MIKRKDLTIYNIVDYISQEQRKKTRQRMFWNRKQWKVVDEFIRLFDYKTENGFYFLGIRHFKK